MVNEHMPTPDEMKEMFSGVELRCLDIETTGFSREKDYVIELGMVVMNCGVVKFEGEVMFGGGKSHPESLKVHGITDQERIGLPVFAEKAKHFKKVVEDPAVSPDGKDIPVIFVGHNGDKFDIPFLVAKCKQAGHPIMTKDGNLRTVDTAKLARKHLSSPDYKLETLCKVYGLEHGNHRGLGDTWSCLNLLAVCMKKGKLKHVLDISRTVGI
jgi:DNA polymerase III epsilon subunit-like protein